MTMTFQDVKAELAAINELFKAAGHLYAHMLAGDAPEAKDALESTLFGIDDRLSRLLDDFPEARDSRVILDLAKVVRRAVHTLEAS